MLKTSQFLWLFTKSSLLQPTASQRHSLLADTPCAFKYQCMTLHQLQLALHLRLFLYIVGLKILFKISITVSNEDTHILLVLGIKYWVFLAGKSWIGGTLCLLTCYFIKECTLSIFSSANEQKAQGSHPGPCAEAGVQMQS